MKKIYITTILIITTQLINAQLINPGFETWTNDFLVPTAMNPNSGNNTYGWWDYNYFNSSFAGSSPISVERCTDTVHAGNYSVKLKSVVYTPTSWNIYKYWGISFIGHEYNDTLGILFNGKADVTNQTFKPGIAFTQKISEFNFYYQYNPNGIDTAECRVSLMSGGQLVAGGVFKTNVATGSAGWQQATVNMTYVDTLTPDTIYVLISATSLDGTPKAGSVLWIDDVSVTPLSTGVEQILQDENSMMMIYPNPFSESTTLYFPDPGNEKYSLTVIDGIGKLVYFLEDISDNQIQLKKGNLQSGVYYVQLKNKNQTLSTKKIIIE